MNTPADVSGSGLILRGALRVVVDERTEREGDVRVNGAGRVADPLPVGRETAVDQSGEMLDVSGCVLTPGLVNAHHHLLQSGFRTLPGTRGVAMREWLPVMAHAYAEAGIDASLVSATAAVGMAESLLDGVTTVADHQLSWPDPTASASALEDTVDIAQAIGRTAEAIGARLVFVRGTARDDAGFAAASTEAIAETFLGREHCDGVRDDGLRQLAVGPAGVHSDAEETFRRLGDVARRLGLRRRTQANEQVDTEIAMERYGRRPIDLLEEWGWLDADVTIAHLCDVTNAEIDRLARAGTSATHVPGCDVSMGWGIAPVAKLLDAGVTVGLGTSGGGSNDAGHLLADARLAMQISALVGPALAARTVLGLATAKGAVGLGRSDLGHLRPGGRGDICAWDVSGVADAGVADPVEGLLWASPGRRPRHVVVGGRVVVRDYRLVASDEVPLVDALTRRIAAVRGVVDETAEPAR